MGFSDKRSRARIEYLVWYFKQTRYLRKHLDLVEKLLVSMHIPAKKRYQILMRWFD